MSLITPRMAQVALLAYLKSQQTLVDLLGTPGQIKETQWQGTEFVYPAIRLGNDIMPSIEGCASDKLEGAVLVMDEQKSSDKCSQISEELGNILHRCSFISPINGIKFSRIWVTRITYPQQMEDRSIWLSRVEIQALIN